MEIIEGNKLIAEFVCEKSGERIYKWKMFDDLWADEGLKFDSSWGWLMAAVEKINKWHSDTMCEKMDFYLLNQSICSSKKMVWDGCIEFITWYNINEPKI